VFASFLARLPPARSDPLPPHPARLEDALQRLSEVVQDPSIRSREACSSMAFSCVPPGVVRRRTQIYARAAAGHRCAFSPLDNNGRPKRKYSERVQEEWFEVDRNWISYSAQSEDAPIHKQVATLDERLETLSQKLGRELTLTRFKWHVPRVSSHTIERIGLANGFTSRIANTANLAARAIQRLPV